MKRCLQLAERVIEIKYLHTINELHFMKIPQASKRTIQVQCYFLTSGSILF